MKLIRLNNQHTKLIYNSGIVILFYKSKPIKAIYLNITITEPGILKELTECDNALKRYAIVRARLPMLP